MLRVVLAILIALAIALPVRAAEATERIERTFTIEKEDGQRTVAIDNVSGSIEVAPASGDAVELVLVQTWRGRNDAEVARAKAAVVLEVHEELGRLVLKQGGSWRCHGRSSCDNHDYDVDFAWTLRVPDDVGLDLGNVNGGRIHVKGGAGHVMAKHVNGPVEIDDASGIVDARTVNGRVTATFSTAPKLALSFGTVNGSIDLTFPKDLDSNIEFSTVNGELFTDFEYTTALPNEAPNNALARLLKGSGKMYIRIGDGGAPIRCETVNGNITIHSR